MDRAKQPAVYLMASERNGTLYVGVTSNLVQRVWEHRNHVVPGFTSRYAVTRLVWFELHASMPSAIAREKTLKAWRRAWKVRLVEDSNPTWDDLWTRIAGAP
jgi:putative endonuclease